MKPSGCGRPGTPSSAPRTFVKSSVSWLIMIDYTFNRSGISLRRSHRPTVSDVAKKGSIWQDLEGQGINASCPYFLGETHEKKSSGDRIGLRQSAGLECQRNLGGSARGEIRRRTDHAI